MSSLADLLPLQSETRKPNAYDVFGLTPCEQDMDKITAAAIATIEHLKSVKDQTDPNLWQQAAKMVDQARQVLADPIRKAALDAKLGSATVVDSPGTRPNELADPLAGLLPAGDPFATVPVGLNDFEPGSIDMPPGLFGTPAETNKAPTAEAVSNAAVVQSEVRPARRRQRRKRSNSSSWILGILAIGLLGATGLLAYFVFYGPGTVEIVKSGNKITISTESEAGLTPQINPARPVGQQDAAQPRSEPSPRVGHGSTERDPIMGSLLDSRPADQQPASVSPRGSVADGADSELAMTNKAPPGQPMIESPTSDLPATPQSVDVPMMEPPKQQEALENVRQLIRSAQWDKMKVAAEALAAAQLSPENKNTAQGIYELADLATYYRDGIKRAVAELDVGNDFEITDSLRVIVVEKGDDLLTVRYNKKNRTFRFDEFPFSLAHKLATFQVPNSPTGQAAKAVYQAIAPKATDAHRDDAIKMLNAIRGEVEGADPARLAETIRSIYQATEQ